MQKFFTEHFYKLSFRAAFLNGLGARLPHQSLENKTMVKRFRNQHLNLHHVVILPLLMTGLHTNTSHTLHSWAILRSGLE